MWLFLAAPWIGLQCAIVVFPNHTRLLFVPHIKVWKLRDSKKQDEFSESIANRIRPTSTVDMCGSRKFYQKGSNIENGFF